MSESIVRKVQPFTIGTRLSVPVVPKCPDFTHSYLQSSSSSSSLDNCVALQRKVNDSVSLYLSRSQVCARGPRLIPSLVNHPLPVPGKQRREDMAAEDHANQNTVSSAAASRSIKKITISGNVESADSVEVALPHKLPVKTFPSENNNNNNNITTTSKTQLPRIVGVSCENKPSAQFKVLLRKDSIDCGSIQGQTRLQLNRGKSIQQISVPRPRSPKRELQNKAVWPHIDGAAAATLHTDCFAQRTSLFTTEILQAEAWIKRKQQDLKDSCNIQCCPLQDRKKALQTIQRDLRDFENTLIQLNQMGEQLICKLNPLSDLVKKQFSQLRDQWQALKQTVANQSRVMGGAKNLQEFNKKVDKLEAWIKDKEEGEQTLAGVLRENLDKMQLTRRILDLKQDEQLHRNLLEEINHLALSLEKQGKADGRNISSRRKHINKMWLRVQAHLKNYHENLHLALEASSFYQQADNTLFAINNMRKSMSACKDPETYGDREIRDIASQIMMLDVTVSQLSNLHPALADGVTQKQSELKDCWGLLQKAFRSDRAALPSYGSTFTREDVDPLTPAREPQCSVGMEPLRTMGKEVKEEHNHLKGYVNMREETSARRPPGSRSPEQQTASHNPSPQSIDPTRTHDVMLRHQSEPDSRKAQAEPRLAVTTRGHTQLHVQLQKFTMSADKTLSWLKNSVAMATQVCSLASCEGPEAAKRCQDVLEQEIRSNGARIEVVKKEGRELVRAQHPGSAKIQVFLSQLEVLWEELRRRHQRNSVFLQASEELGFRVVKVLQALGSLDAWLESVELSMRESSLAGDPETMSVAERQSCLLEREVAARSLELSALRQEVDRLGGQCLPHARALPARMEEVEKKYHRVQSVLTQQSSELQDTRMLTEFLERVELEETQDFSSSHYSLGQPLHTDISSAAAALGLQSAGDSESLLESMGDPVEELREAVEMLNDTVRERGRSQSHDQAVQQLLSKHASVAVRVEECLRCSKELCMNLLEREADMAVKCEPDRCGLMGLQDTQEQLENIHGTIALEVEEMKSQASRLEELCPERVHVLASKIQATLEAWTELRKSVTENRRRMEEFVQLQGFFRSYLAMISWTEDTRSCIFSDTALHLGTDGMLDRQIEQKFEEFDELASTGRNLLDAEHHLTEMVKERMEELRSMLGWISVHWRAQKQQWLLKTKTQNACQDNIYTEATLGSPFSEASAPEQDTYMFCQSLEGHTCTVDSPASTTPTGQGGSLSEDGYEVMKSLAPRGGEAFSTESSKSSVVVLKEAGPPSLGATVNLMLSFGGRVDSEVQILELPSGTEEEEMSELVHRVSTYLHVKDNNLALTPVYESITLPRQKTHPSASAASSARPRSTSPSLSPVQPPQTASVSLNPAVRGGSGSIFSSLKRMGKKRKRKRDARRHTIQKVMGVEGRKDGEPCCCVYEPIAYDNRTWPLKEGRRQTGSPHSPVGGGGESAAYVKNPLLKDIESECSGEYVITPYAMSEGPSALPSASHTRSHCRFLSLGSVISFDLPTDMSLIPSIQDVITIAHPESKKAGGTDPDANTQTHRHTALSSFKQTAAFSPSPAATSSSCNLPQGQTQGQNQGQTQGQTQGQNQGQTKGQIRVSLVTDLADVDKETQPPPAIGLGEDEKQAVPCDVLSDSHKCLGVHTLTQGLRTHPYHKSANPRYATEEGPAVSQACHMVVSLKRRQDSVDSGVSSCGSFKVCSDNLQPRGVVGRMLSLDVGAIGCSKPGVSSLAAASAVGEARPVCVDRQQFEEEEEELEDIWSRSSSSSYRRSVCSDIMYQPHREEAAPDSLPPPGSAASQSPAPKAPAVLYRKLATASAPDLLVAELRLPSSVQTLLGYGRGRGSVDQLPLVAKAGHSRSWAVLPDREVACEPSPAANETASAQVTLRHIEDSGRYIYQYREVEEDQEKEEEEVVEECTGCWKNPSISVDVNGVGQQRTGSSDCLEDKHEEQMATRGRSNTMSGVPELQSMEGTLERKHKLQFGGKRAPCRGWNSYHAVLHRNTLCFYQDTKDALRSSVCGLPLNLTGAECSPAPEYTKKPNCFCLRLRDGSEYLFNASSRFMMKKWMLKIQACTGPSGSVPLYLSVPVKPGLPAALSSCSACHGLSQCLCPSRHDAISTFPRRKATGPVQAKEIVVLTREYSHTTQSCLKRPQEQFTVAPSSAGLCDKGLCQGDDLGGVRRTSPLCSDEECLSNKQRSHSFTSATYQKIRPPFQTAAVGGGSSSNYSVTLVIGDKASGSPSVSRGPEVPQLGVAGAWPDPALRSYASLPRPHNKSVFKKFFGKSDGHV